MLAAKTYSKDQPRLIYQNNTFLCNYPTPLNRLENRTFSLDPTVTCDAIGYSNGGIDKTSDAVLDHTYAHPCETQNEQEPGRVAWEEYTYSQHRGTYALQHLRPCAEIPSLAIRVYTRHVDAIRLVFLRVVEHEMLLEIRKHLQAFSNIRHGIQHAKHTLCGHFL